MNWEHPELQEMLGLGCSNPMKVMLAFQSYMHLCEVEKLHNVKYFYNSDLDLLYLSSSDKKKLVFHVPIPAQFSLSPAWMHNVNTVLLKENPLAEVNILLRTPDTTLLPYKLTEGLCPPPTPESTKEKKAIQEKIQLVQSELHKRKKELYEEAKRKRIETSEVCVNQACDDKRASADEKCLSDDKRSDDSEMFDEKRVRVDDNDKRSSDSETLDDKRVGLSVVDKSSSDSKMIDDNRLGVDDKNCTGIKTSDNETLDDNKMSVVDKRSSDMEPFNDKKENISDLDNGQNVPISEMSIDKKDLDMDCEVSCTSTNDL